MAMLRLRKSSPDLLTSVIIIINIFLLCILFYLVIFPPSRAPSAPSLLQNSVAYMNEQERYKLIITERSDDYTLSFEGYYWEDQLYGLLSQYNLNIYRKNKLLYIKENDSAGWQPASVYELEGLGAFLYTPLELLQKIDFNRAKFGPDRSMNGKASKTIYVPLNLTELPTIFPEMDPQIMEEAEAKLFLWVDADDLFLHQMSLSITLELPEYGSRQVVRTFSVSAKEKKDLPDIVPPRSLSDIPG